MNCLQAIRTKYESLTAAEKRVADHLLTHREEAVGLSISQLAERAQVAKSAVVRFCKTLGLDGYSQLKLQLAAETAQNKQLNYTPYIYPEDTADTIIDKVFSANVKALHDTAAFLDHKAAAELIRLLLDAKTVYLYGIGTSSGMVTELQYRLMQLGLQAFAFTDPPTMKVSTMNITKGDLAIGISHSGRTIATIDALELAQRSGAAAACITSFPESPITRVCQLSLCVYCDELQYPVEAMSAKIAQLSLIYALTTALSAANYEETVQRSKQARALVNTIRLEETP